MVVLRRGLEIYGYKKIKDPFSTIKFYNIGHKKRHILGSGSTLNAGPGSAFKHCSSLMASMCVSIRGSQNQIRGISFCGYLIGRKVDHLVFCFST